MGIRIIIVALGLSIFGGGVAARDRATLLADLESSRDLIYDSPRESLLEYRRLVAQLDPTQDLKSWLEANILLNAALFNIGLKEEFVANSSRVMRWVETSPHHASHARLLAQQVWLHPEDSTQRQVLLAKALELLKLEYNPLVHSFILQLQASEAQREGLIAEPVALMREAYYALRDAPRTPQYYALLNNVASINLDEWSLRGQEGLEMAQEVAAFASQRRLRFLMATAYQTLGGGLLSAGRYEEASQALAKSKAAAQEIGDELGVGYALFGQGRSLRMQKRWSEAIAPLRSARAIGQRFDDQGFLSHVEVVLAICLVEQGAADEALALVEGLIGKTSHIPLKSLHLDLLEVQGRIAEQRGDSEGAMRAYKQLSEMQQKTFDAKNQELSVRYFAEFEVDRRDERNRYLTQKNQIQQLAIENQRRQNLLLVLSLCGSIGLAGAISFDFVRVRRRNREIQKLHKYIERNVLQRFLPPLLVQEILEGRSRLDDKARSETVTILFADLCQFTQATERLGPQTIAHILNDFFVSMTDIVFEDGGTVDKFIGDAIMVIFGAPTSMDPVIQARLAVRCAQRMHARLEELNRSWQLSEGQQFAMRIGIHQGPAVVGSFGGARRSDYTVVGTAVNLSARVENLAEPQSIQITQQVAQHLAPQHYRLRGRFRIRGLDQEIDLYTVIPAKNEALQQEAS